ncbi:MAG: FtsQ-type POTRA domain-containing protein, partial [Defluviitaleaceae bacterium]|nr:FtsQ-type POTRA domain-containing protein [Defluviitaleaceae bacterium]
MKTNILRPKNKRPISRRRHPKSRRRKPRYNIPKGLFRIMMIVAGLVFFVIIILASGIFEIREINIIGNSILQTSEIMEMSGLSLNQNILAINRRGIEERISENPFIWDVRLHRDFPNRVIISITERVPIAYAGFNNFNTYLLIDDTGMVLDSSAFAAAGLPVIIGLDIINFSIGGYLDMDNMRIFQDILILSRLLGRYD